MSNVYAVLGAGRQGTAAAYDMSRWGDAGRVILADWDLDAARQAAERVNKLIGRTVADATEVDVTDFEAVVRVLTDADAFLSAVPYYYNLDITKAALEARAHVCDLGATRTSPAGNTASTRTLGKPTFASSPTAVRFRAWAPH